MPRSRRAARGWTAGAGGPADRRGSACRVPAVPLPRGLARGADELPDPLPRDARPPRLDDGGRQVALGRGATGGREPEGGRRVDRVALARGGLVGLEAVREPVGAREDLVERTGHGDHLLRNVV